MAHQYPKFLYNSRFADAAPAASSTAAGFAVANLTDWRPYTWWQPSSLPATVTVDCGSAKAADYAALYAHDCASRGNTVEIRGSTDNFGASDVLVASSAPADDGPLVLTFASVSYRYWRLRIVNGTAPTIAIAAIGAALTMPRLLDAGFDPTTRQVVGVANRSENGHPLGRIVDWEAWEQALSWGLLSWSWIRATWVPAWIAHLRGSPYLFAWDAGDHPGESRLVQSSEGYETAHQVGELAELKLTVRGVAP